MIDDGRKPVAHDTGITAQEVAGVYVYKGKNEEATLTITALADNRVKVEGFALWGTKSLKDRGPHEGDLDFEAPLKDGRVYFVDPVQRPPYRIRLDFQKGRLTAREANWLGHFGMNVKFEGEYRRVSGPGNKPGAGKR